MPGPRLILAICALALSGVAAGCGNHIDVAEKSGTVRKGAVLFNERCSGCHSIDAADAYGSKPSGKATKGGERTDGPNFNVRKENREDVLYAIRNGGFSGAIMPANIVVGKDADAVALFLERYAGSKSEEGGSPAKNAGSGGGQ
jgi:mono/diheme cytochrome c family protein